jgi:para-aminobenzoate synthetase/4-amino-4-deoxychorismate lyase
MSAFIFLQDHQHGRWLIFRNPVHLYEIHRPDEVTAALREIERATQERGLWAAGFLSYEAAPAFDPALQSYPPADLPLLYFGLYPKPEPIPYSVFHNDPSISTLPSPIPNTQHAPRNTQYTFGDWQPSIKRDVYNQAIAEIKEHIAAGDTYQVNYTFRLHSSFEGNAWGLFLDLIQKQQGHYAAYADTGRYAICSASPELFFRLDGRTLTSRPMKGTARRGRTLAEDQAQSDWLRHSEKNQAENVMIVDMIRNDLGRIATTGSVYVPSLFDVERYPTLWQMTSTVTAESDAPITGILSALFPCASITGAPKVRTMRIINRLETTPRGVYTGCIGYIAPNRQAQFNVAIRTVTINRQTGQAEYGVGGGIVWDSTAETEYEECRLKARVLLEKRPSFDLLETMLWTPAEGYFLLDYHLRRLAESAEYFGYPLIMAEVRDYLMSAARSFGTRPHRVRLLLPADGALRLEGTLLDTADPPQPTRLGLAQNPVDSSNVLLYHKTTHRQPYDDARAQRPNCDDVLLYNERGEITESTLANIVVRLDGVWYTPPVTCGLLPGTYRAWLLDQGQIQERVISLDEVKTAAAIALINSVRLWRDAILTLPTD